MVKILRDRRPTSQQTDNMASSAPSTGSHFAIHIIRTLEAAGAKGQAATPAPVRSSNNPPQLQRAQCSSPLLCLSAPTRRFLSGRMFGCHHQGRPPRLRNRRCRFTGSPEQHRAGAGKRCHHSASR